MPRLGTPRLATGTRITVAFVHTYVATNLKNRQVKQEEQIFDYVTGTTFLFLKPRDTRGQKEK